MARTLTKLGDSQVDDTLANHLAKVTLARFSRKHHWCHLIKTIKANEQRNYVQKTRWHPNSSLLANVILKQPANGLAKVSSLLQKHSHFPRTVNVD